MLGGGSFGRFGFLEGGNGGMGGWTGGDGSIRLGDIRLERPSGGVTAVIVVIVALMAATVITVLFEIGGGGGSEIWRLLKTTFDGVTEGSVSIVDAFVIGTP